MWLTGRCTLCNGLGMENLATYLNSRGISQREFARLLGVDPSIVSRLVHGLMRPSLELAVKIERLTSGRIKAASWVPASTNRCTDGNNNQSVIEIDGDAA
mgnify:CR=1 FL=1